ncbi:hypothetical protein Sango_2994100 [Sesamum angolense]|uniref:DUF4378 domain-containing protein n=1 Tax=Sesamum angolense TaxID=2727404 RepID=A0AAE1T4S4_9LAMI|nr:hypothetical protein Sango_2994100 [Sesamum angolense]
MALLPCENRPMMLKDFLRDDSHTSLNGYPRNSRMLLISSQPNKPSGVLIRSRSKKAAATTISAIHKVINVVKLFQFGSVRSPLVLPRSISRKFPKSRDRNVDISDLPEVKVKVKDILRWKSFRDLVEDDPVPSDVPSSPNRSTTGTTTSCSQSRRKGQAVAKPSHRPKQQNQEDYLTILDFFMHELSTKGKFKDVKFDSEIVKSAKAWMNGEYDESYEWEVEDNRTAYVKDMEKGVCWNKFKQEQEEMSLELQDKVLDELINELSADFLCK